MLVCTASPSLAQQQSESPLTGSVALGTRSVDVEGTETKYKEDINLDSGVRIFDVDLSYAPDRGEDLPVDRIDLQVSNLGGDPFESAHLGVRKYGSYELKLDHRRSQYFYEDTILPAALASIPGSTGGDFHHFDFERVRDTASLEIDVAPGTQVTFGIERQSRRGDSTTTLDIERDEFELERPLDETLNRLDVGVRHSWRKVSLLFSEERRDFENSSELFLPGASQGQNTTDLAELQFFRLDQSYDYGSSGHMLRVLANPTARLDMQAAWHSEDLDLDMQASEESLGTSFAGLPVATSASGPAEVGRNLDFVALDFGYTIGERLRLVGGARTSTLEQSGLLLFGADQGAGTWNIETDGAEVGLEIAALPKLIVTAGRSTETRDTTHAQALNTPPVVETSSTDRAGYFARLLFNPGSGFEITAALEDDSIDDPFTLASPTSGKRYKVTASQRWENGVAVTAIRKRTDAANDVSGWAAETEQTELRVRYTTTRFELSAGYGDIDLSRNVDQLVTGGTRQDLFVIAYDADATFLDASARWALNAKVTLGGDLREYENRGSFPLDRDDRRAFLDIALSRDYALQIAYRDVDYSEDAFDSYDSKILELALRLGW